MEWINLVVGVGVEEGKALCSVHIKGCPEKGYMRQVILPLKHDDLGYVLGQAIKDLVVSNRTLFEDHLAPVSDNSLGYKS